MKTSPIYPRYFDRSFQTLPLIAGLSLAIAGAAAAVDVNFIGILKGQRFSQSSPDWASLMDQGDQADDLPLMFEVMAVGAASDSLVSGTVQIPGGGTVPLAREFPGDAEFRCEFHSETLADINISRPSGTYTVNLSTKNDATKTISLTLAGDAYPNIPLITNFNTLQAIPAASDTLVQWAPMTGGTANDFILCMVSDNGTGDVVFESGMPGSPGALNGSAVQVTIPANTLQPGHSYETEVIFIKTVAIDTSYAPAVAGYYKLVNFNIKTNVLPGLPLGSGFVRAIPEANASEVARDSAITFRFSKPMESNKSVIWTINSSPVNAADFSYEWIDGNEVLLCRPNSALPANATIGWTLDLTGFRDAGNSALSGTESGKFQTSSDDPSSPPDANGVYVTKMRAFRQTGASPTSTGMWGCDPGVELSAFNRVKSATLTVAANGRIIELPQQPWGCSMSQETTYASQADLDRFFANGDFTFAMTPLADGAKTVTLSLGSTDDYPPAPTVTNLAALQSINQAAPVTITWDALSGWDPGFSIGGGMIELEIANSAGNEVLWVSNEQLSSGTQFTIPAGTLWPGRAYQVSLYFTRIKDLDDTSYPGAFAATGFTSVTDFTITTGGVPAMPSLAIERVNSSMHLTATGGEPNREYVMESSQDLQRWLPQTNMWPGDQSNSYQDGDAYYLKNRFYRLRDRAPNEIVQRNITIQGTVWTDNTHLTPVPGAAVGTSLDGRTTVTDSSGRFFLETDTQSNFGSAPYTVTVTAGATIRGFGPGSWGDQPRDQNFEMN